MALEVTCPKCNHHFQLEDALSDELKEKLEEEKKQLRKEMIEFKNSKEQELKTALEKQKTDLQKTLEENIRKSVNNDFENQLKLLQESNKNLEEVAKASRAKELEFLKKEQELKSKSDELELTLQRKLAEERNLISEKIRLEEQQKNSLKETEHVLKNKELEKRLEDTLKMVDDLKRKSEQGSMQLQGEVQELALEDLLKNNFPYDDIEEVGKGVKGADCIQTVKNQFGQECGKIIYESKRTKDFSNEWIEKLKADMRSKNADIAIIVTQAMPKDLPQFGEKDGVWICNFSEVNALATVLRLSIIKIYSIQKSQENKGDKMNLLYSYLTGNEFSSQWKAIREGFLAMKINIQKEKDAMEKIWKAREKQLEKIVLNAAHIKGSIEGIAGQDSIDLSLADDNNEDLLLLD